MASCNPGTQPLWCEQQGEKHWEPVTAETLQGAPLSNLLSETRCCWDFVPRFGCGMTVSAKAFSTATESREPDFGSQSTKEQHNLMKGPTTCISLAHSLCAKAESRTTVKASHAQDGLPCAIVKAKPICHQGQPNTWLPAGCGHCPGGRAKEKSPQGGMQMGCCGEGLEHGMSLHL